MSAVIKIMVSHLKCKHIIFNDFMNKNVVRFSLKSRIILSFYISIK